MLCTSHCTKYTSIYYPVLFSQQLSGLHSYCLMMQRRTLRLREVIQLAWDRLTIKTQSWILCQAWNLNHHLCHTAWRHSGQLWDAGQKYGKTLTLYSRNWHSEQKVKISMHWSVSVSRTQRLGCLSWGAGRLQVRRQCGYMERRLCCHQIWKFQVIPCHGSAPPHRQWPFRTSPASPIYSSSLYCTPTICRDPPWGAQDQQGKQKPTV